MKILGRLWIIFTIALVFGCEFGEEKNSDSESSKNSLTEGEWTDGKISKDGQIKKYTFTVSEWTRYFIYMNNAYDGDDTKTAYTGIKISHSDGTTISSSYNNVTSCYAKPITFLSASDGTVSITMASRANYSWETGTGTYAIKYTSRQEYTTLSNADKWHNDNIIADGQTNRYYIPVDEGMRYFIYMNNAYNGDDTKTAYTGIKISHRDGTIINSSYGNATNCWSSPFTFVSRSDGTITMTVASRANYNWENGTGSYAIKYNSRPEYIILTENKWREDDILTNGQTNKYYISVTAGTRYNIQLNDATNGDNSKTANRIGIKIIYTQDSNSSNPNIQNSYTYNHWASPYSFNAPDTGTIIITAASYSNYNWEQGTGTYAIRYTVSD